MSKKVASSTSNINDGSSKTVRSTPSTKVDGPSGGDNNRRHSSQPKGSGATWKGFTDCKNLKSYNEAKGVMESLPLMTADVQAKLDELNKLKEKIRRYKRNIQKEDKTEDWDQKLKKSRPKKKELASYLDPFLRRQTIRQKLEHWSSEWKKYKEKYNAGDLSEEEFKRAMTEMANDLSSFTSKNEATEKPGKPIKTT
ncbi:hypothetical protein PNOK_0072100 [Pyrrhoderma noxium]|uniref:Uncharacterized protein n=1 Tax=Pyrrhoderma noxium TaxID=2282107 RepID=A0A286UVM4_9AGAM|nr:hypothetical protein PNOK_0072100 [Pyrrhoderma noxium]